MYADKQTDAMRKAIDETDRRRAIQRAYNDEHGITPETIVKGISDISEFLMGDSKVPTKGRRRREKSVDMEPHEIEPTIVELEEEMLAAAEELRFEYAAKLRDEIRELRRELDEAQRRSRRAEAGAGGSVRRAMQRVSFRIPLGRPARTCSTACCRCCRAGIVRAAAARGRRARSRASARALPGEAALRGGAAGGARGARLRGRAGRLARAARAASAAAAVLIVASRLVVALAVATRRRRRG